MGTQKVSVAWMWGGGGYLMPQKPSSHPGQPHLHGQAPAQVHGKDGHSLPPVVDGEDKVLPLFVLIQDSQQCCGQAGQGRKGRGVNQGPVCLISNCDPPRWALCLGSRRKRSWSAS